MEKNEEEGVSMRTIVIEVLRQVRVGSDLSKVTLPTCILEPRSLLERLTDFMVHPEGILHASRHPDAEMRFLNVIEYYLSGWHVRPSGIKKPYNPVLGEMFKCSWKTPLATSSQVPDHWSDGIADCPICSKEEGEEDGGGESFFFAEQISHHPPESVYYFESPRHGVRITGSFLPRSRFMRLSAVSILGGSSVLQLMSNEQSEEYILTYPNIYVRGIFFGKLMTELGDTVTIVCAATDLKAEITFRTKGIFGGSFDAVDGNLKRISSGELIYKIQGHWSSLINFCPIDSTRSNFSIDIATLPRNIPDVPATEHQMESRRLWERVTDAVKMRDYVLATTEKKVVEENQRNRTESKPCSKWFVQQNGRWRFGKLDEENDCDKRREKLEILVWGSK